MFLLEISKVNDFDFFCVCLLWGIGLIIFLAVAGALIELAEACTERRERKRRNKNRRGYVYINTDRRYK